MAKKKTGGGLNPFAEKLIARLTEITEGKPTKTDEFTERDHALAVAVSKVGGCATSNLLELISLLERRKLPKISGDGETGIFPKGTVLFLTGNTNGHNYKRDEPVLVWDGYQGLMQAVRIGNNLPIGSNEEFEQNGRKATPDEIRAYVMAIWPKIVSEAGGALILKGDYGDAFWKFSAEIGATE